MFEPMPLLLGDYAGAVVLLFVFVFFFCMIRFFRKKERAFILKIEEILC